MPKLMTICPVHGDVVPTGAVMSARQFDRLKGDLAIYCPACRAPHGAARDRVWREGTPEPAHGETARR